MLRERRSAIIYLVTFIALFILCYLFPYVHDDWAWGSQIGIDRLNSGFSDYGGRYLGYILVMIMTRSKVLAALIMSGTLVGIGACIKRIVNSKWAFLAGLILIFLVSREILAQSISWVSGFANYATTTLVVLVFINILIDVFAGKIEKWYAVILAMLFGFAGSLILENVTLYLVAVSIISQIYLLVKKKQFSPVLFALMIGAGVGAAWMFSNSTYHNVATGEDEYRSTVLSIEALLTQVKNNYMEVVYPYGFFKNVILNFLLLVGGVCMFQLRQGKKRKAQTLMLVFLIVSVVYSTISNVIVGDTAEIEVFSYFEGFLSLVAVFAMFGLSMSFSERRTADRRKYMLLWLSFFVLLAPLFIINPIGPRNFLTPYVILVTVGLLWWRSIFDILRTNHKRFYNTIINNGNLMLGIAAVSVWLVYVGIFAAITKADTLRLQNIKQQIDEGREVVLITPLPYEQLMWQSTPREEAFEERYKLFYNLPLNIEIQVKNN